MSRAKVASRFFRLFPASEISITFSSTATPLQCDPLWLSAGSRVEQGGVGNFRFLLARQFTTVAVVGTGQRVEGSGPHGYGGGVAKNGKCFRNKARTRTVTALNIKETRFIRRVSMLP